MNIRFDNDVIRTMLYPFTATRQAADIRIGILTIREKWNKIAEQLPVPISGTGNFIPTIDWIKKFNEIEEKGEGVYANENLVRIIEYPWDIFKHNDWALRKDFELITKGRKSQPISSSNRTTAPENIFIEEGAVVEHSILNASTGPVYIGKNAEVMEGCTIRGAFALCEGAVLKMGSKVYGATTIGPYCVAAGEIKNSVMFGYSNKAHDGYLGDSVVGEWCNLGAGTTNSNVKNTAGVVNVWSQQAKAYLPAGPKCGLLMGDYSRAAINTSFNTGTVVGVSCNVFGNGFPPKFIPDFTWGKERYSFDKAIHDINSWKKLKGQTISGSEEQILTDIYKQL